MLGYWGKPTWGDRPYLTGDRVRVLPDRSFEYLGRPDNMVKVRGVRMDLGEIENAIYRHDRVSQAAVIAVGEGLDKHLVAAIEPEGDKAPGLLELKRHCAELL
jgi:acyl-coenzyme A synthetase/AMP-(fatty) acid ligase